MPLLEKLHLKRRGAAGPITTNLNMEWGVTEQWLKGPSARAKTLKKGSDELARLGTDLATVLSTDVTLAQEYASLQADINALQARSIGNNAVERDGAIADIARLTTAADKLAVFRYDPDAIADTIRMRPEPADPHIRDHLLIDSPRLARLLNTLPETTAGVRALDGLETWALATPNFIGKEQHKLFFTRKTEMQETAVEDAINGSDNQRLAGLRNLPKDKYWKLLIDGKEQAANNKHVFEASQGYMAGMMNGLNRVVQRINEPLSQDLVEDLHRAATQNVTTQSIHDFVAANSMQRPGLKASSNEWHVCRDFSLTALTELEDLRGELITQLHEIDPAANARGYFVDADPIGDTEGSGGIPGSRAGGKLEGQELQGVTGRLIDISIDTYKNEIRQANGNEEAVLGAVVDCCRRLGMIHPFQDANGRVIMLLVLNRLLLENGKDPTILESQGMMIGKGRAELVAMIREGQAKVAALRT
jgi:hypothetical protein